ncbi:binding--dependent transport system inner membrane component family protein [Burkholderia thailandensis MSMB121]|uniref:Iron ABC transporter permease n=2 Tax=Burkholderia humptydooensis TaxID=430531 RepID=A0A7U4SVK1_9BURK|nr:MULTISPECIES: iron ABC transporter permease [Burkholderia]AGK50505.1 binding--dependent transport system inner membrane component family protein [Burkholderia thailandensis MSMB121]ATF34109.1 iron ABC transporter permease [Burkholderia thailandensis]AJY39080.1 binding--dependent transport system inner membrane component family protein [Burkholderia sp. 2002721687]ALX47046.1 spermidine/putrescine ABC transporter permease [Burkholderia humptydooensis]KST72520.1 spermidine/putrescine ABC trans
MLTTRTGRPCAPMPGALGGGAQGAPSAGGLWPLAGMLRWIVVAVLTIAVALPIAFIVFQSLLSAPFFDANRTLGVEGFRFIFGDPDFWSAVKNSFVIAGGMLFISIPLGGVLAFLMVRTDLPGRRWLEPLVLTPVFVSPMVLAFGYVVAAGPVGFYSVWFKALFGVESVPWNVYSIFAITVIVGLTHVPHVYLYASAALRNLGSDVEEAARVAGARPFRVALDVSLPMTLPALLFSGVLVFFLGFEVFGLPLVLGDPEGHLVLATYLYKLTNKLGVPSYHLMAAVAVCIIAITFPLVLLQRHLLKSANRYVTVKGKAGRATVLPLRAWRWVALAIVAAWLALTVIVPISGIVLRAFVTNWGEGVPLAEVLTVANFVELFEQDNLVRAIVNTLGIGVIGGALAIGFYSLVAFAGHRRHDWVARMLDYIVLLPRAVPGLLAGLAFLWIFLFVPGLRELKSSMWSIWIAYTVVWLAYGMRVIQSALLQVGPELEEAGRSVGATRARVSLDVTLPLVRFGLLAAWLLIFMIFEREYSTAVYLLSPGTEVIGALLVSLWATGAVDQVAALSVINIAMVGAGLAVALRFGVKLHG